MHLPPRAHGRQPRRRAARQLFDVVCSVSVLEEVPIETVRDILKHAARLLKTGGALIGTHDLLTEVPERIGEYVAAHAAAGLYLPIETPAPESNNKTLIENPTVAMIAYQMNEPETRNYWGALGDDLDRGNKARNGRRWNAATCLQ